MKEIILYPAVYLGMASMPALFFTGLYLLLKDNPSHSASPKKRWLLGVGYSAATLAGWAVVYCFGEHLPLGPTVNSLASLSLMFGYSAYMLLFTAALTVLITMVGALVSVVREN